LSPTQDVYDAAVADFTCESSFSPFYHHARR
jgi:hypothetical protein